MSWPHAPSKVLTGPGLFIIIAGTYQKQHLFKDRERLRVLEQSLFESALATDWEAVKLQ